MRELTPRIARTAVAIGLAAAVSAAAAGALPRARSTVREETMQVVIAGGGSVTASRGPIHCPGTCDGAYGSGEVVTLTARASRYWAFHGWSGACVGVVTSCTVAVGAGGTAHASFTRVQALVLVEVGGPGEIVSTPAGLACGVTAGAPVSGCMMRVLEGSSISVEAVPAPGGSFAGWGLQCKRAPTVSCSLTASRPRDLVSATFGLAAPQAGMQPLTATSQDVMSTPGSHPAGLVCADDAQLQTCQGSFVSGTLVTLTGEGSWSGACLGDLGSCTVDVDAPASVGWTALGTLAFTGPTQFGVNVTLSGPGRVIIGGQPRRTCSRLSGLPGCQTLADLDSKVVLTAVPAAGTVRLARWSGACVGSKLQCSLFIYGSVNIGATFLTPPKG